MATLVRPLRIVLLALFSLGLTGCVSGYGYPYHAYSPSGPVYRSYGSYYGGSSYYPNSFYGPGYYGAGPGFDYYTAPRRRDNDHDRDDRPHYRRHRHHHG